MGHVIFSWMWLDFFYIICREFFYFVIGWYIEDKNKNFFDALATRS